MEGYSQARLDSGDSIDLTNDDDTELSNFIDLTEDDDTELGQYEDPFPELDRAYR
jgi:hypothetical protein